jgi:hypothetical protein
MATAIYHSVANLVVSQRPLRMNITNFTILRRRHNLYLRLTSGYHVTVVRSDWLLVLSSGVV